MNTNDKNSNAHDTRDGIIVFSPQLCGYGKGDHPRTSGFDAVLPSYTAPGYPYSKETASQEKGGRKRKPATSAITRVSKGQEETWL